MINDNYVTTNINNDNNNSNKTIKKIKTIIIASAVAT